LKCLVACNGGSLFKVYLPVLKSPVMANDGSLCSPKMKILKKENKEIF
jgi:hypothetical protein